MTSHIRHDVTHRTGQFTQSWQSHSAKTVLLACFKLCKLLEIVYLAHVLALVEVGRLEEVTVLESKLLTRIQELLNVLHLKTCWVSLPFTQELKTGGGSIIHALLVLSDFMP